MPSCNVSVYDDPTPPTADVLTVDGTNRSFITLRLGADVTVLMPGEGKANAEYARAVADVLHRAAARLEAMSEEGVAA